MKKKVVTLFIFLFLQFFLINRAVAQVPNPSSWENYPPLNTLSGYNFLTAMKAGASSNDHSTFFKFLNEDLKNCNFKDQTVTKRWYQEPYGPGQPVYTQYWLSTGAYCKGGGGDYQVLYAVRTLRSGLFLKDRSLIFAECVSFMGRSPAENSWVRAGSFNGPNIKNCALGSTIDTLILTASGSFKRNNETGSSRKPYCRYEEVGPRTQRSDGTLSAPPSVWVCD